jgi:hypothetical protein
MLLLDLDDEGYMLPCCDSIFPQEISALLAGFLVVHIRQ